MKKALAIITLFLAVLILAVGCGSGPKDLKGRKKKKVSMGWI